MRQFGPIFFTLIFYQIHPTEAEIRYEDLLAFLPFVTLLLMKFGGKDKQNRTEGSKAIDIKSFNQR